MHLAIDYGSKLAGSTAVCFEKNQVLILDQSSRKEDADAWLSRKIHELEPAAVYIDAPLSLPAVYTGKGEDYFYRECDRAVTAMSPMFLGGLTARAMQLRAAFPELEFFEIYPAGLVKSLLPEVTFYKKKSLPEFCLQLETLLPIPFVQQPANWHQVDAALAWLSGRRHLAGEARIVGNKEEGIIII